MSDTPRTDNESLSGQGKSGRSYVSVNFTRQLERELNAANDRIKQIEADKVNLMETRRDREERIKRLEKLGDEMELWCVNEKVSEAWKEAR